MKKTTITTFGILLGFLFLTSCGGRGPVGPEGPEGPSVLPVSFEFNADLLRSNNFEFVQGIPSQIEVFESDVMLAYVFEEFIPEDDLEVWRKIPVLEFNNRGTLLLDYDFTFVDIRIFLDANYSLGALDEFEDLLIRAVHIPADFLNNAKASEVKNAKTIRELQAVIGTEIDNIKIQ